MERLQGIEGVRPTAFSTAYTYHKMKGIVQEFISEALTRGARILDVGCNRGHDLLRISEEHAPLNLRLYGIEVSREDLSVAHSRSKQARGSDGFHFLLSVAEKMPFRDSAFDAIICSEVVEHLPAPDAAIQEMSRVLRSGGILALTTPNAGNKLHKLRKFLPGRMKAIADNWRDMQREIDRDRRRAEGRNLPHVSELSAREWYASLSSAGLEVVDVRRGSLLFGDPQLEIRPVLWALSVIMDKFLDRVSDDWSWQVLFKAKKGGRREEGSSSL